MDTREERYAVVTGASHGFGKFMAIELAQRGINTLLVALPGEDVEHISQQLRSLGTKSHYYETDLSITENVVDLAQWINENFSVYVLINNAGIGGSKGFVESNINQITSMIQLNITATTILIHQLLPNLLKQKDSYILNVSSMASFSPMGYKTVYPASKKFIQHFSRGLRQELKDTCVFVSVVHPGPMITNSTISSRLAHHGVLGKMGLLNPETVAKATIRQLFKKRRLILVGAANRFLWLLMIMVPDWIKLPLLTNAVKREIAFEEKGK